MTLFGLPLLVFLVFALLPVVIAAALVVWGRLYKPTD
jgi:hypothetical protein